VGGSANKYHTPNHQTTKPNQKKKNTTTFLVHSRPFGTLPDPGGPFKTKSLNQGVCGVLTDEGVANFGWIKVIQELLVRGFNPIEKY